MKKNLSIIIMGWLLANGIFAKESAVKSGGGERPIKIINAQSKSVVGPTETFTGKVKVTTVLNPDDSSSISCASVAFEAGARSAWHSHP
ncbi:MAG: hypothetical protein EOP07_27150, partial [Proteobacteria bacterium]